MLRSPSSPVRIWAPLAFAALLGAAAFVACGDQGEGDRCDFDRNGDNDCASTLRCVKKDELSDPSVDRCCPRDRSTATGICAQRAVFQVTDAGAPATSPDAASATTGDSAATVVKSADAEAPADAAPDAR